MILADTSVWIDHLRSGELARGNLAARDEIQSALQNLPRAIVATDDEALDFIGANALSGLGIGNVDVRLLASARLTADARLWTRDKRLAKVAGDLRLAWRPDA